ncbi:unnamed protein product [Fraxinus pennsylvanica]|uniref:Uncharacterized protein n=1 Tax=Fraxinus pennsylvanica TaxID=56036 RepID=A0AAD2DWG0_9LAMI|nr:unnamed protein product [Fraxinus pennsylvanica]
MQHIDEPPPRFLSQNNAPPPPDPVTQLVEAHRTSNIIQRNQDLTNVESTIESLKRSSKEKEEIKLAGIAQQWFPPSIDDLDFNQLQDWLGKYAHFKNIVDNELQRASNPGNQYFPTHAGTDPSFPVPGDANLGFPGLVTTGFAAPNYGTIAPVTVHGSTVPAASFGGDGINTFGTSVFPTPTHYVASGSNDMVLYDSSNPSNYLVPAGASGGSGLNAPVAPYVPMGMGSIFPTYGMDSSSRVTPLPMFDPRNPSPGEGSSRVPALPVFDPRNLSLGEGSSRVTALPMFDPINPSPGEGSSRVMTLPVFDPRNPSPGEGSSRATALPVFDPRNPSTGEGSGASGSNAAAPPTYGSRDM